MPAEITKNESLQLFIMMNSTEEHNYLLQELDDEDRVSIAELFFKEIVPKLRRLDARHGIVNCEFAGKRFKNWSIHFKSAGSGFDIVEFEYDEKGASMDLNL